MSATNDNDVALWLQIASDWYDIALGVGAVGLTPPRAGDQDVILMKKICYYTAAIAAS